MRSTNYIAGFRRQSAHNDLLFETSRIRRAAGRLWRAVASFLQALDKRVTENLDQRARYLLHGDANRSDTK
ncbi:hypothetical protein [Reyranella sp.]|uniref:hypothetical protein n=1 Tax=Reyranella sp. TaxID=1929291 RepID=UPI003D0C8F4B